MDIIVTTPRSEMANATAEAADCIRAGGGEYFRRFSLGRGPGVVPGDRIFYVEDGFVRGFAVVDRADDRCGGTKCETTGRWWAYGDYVFMQAKTWQWIRPIPMGGFRGFRYAKTGRDGSQDVILIGGRWAKILFEGGWRDPRPQSCRACGCTDRYGCPPPRGPCHWAAEDLCSACESEGA